MDIEISRLEKSQEILVLKMLIPVINGEGWMGPALVDHLDHFWSQNFTFAFYGVIDGFE